MEDERVDVELIIITWDPSQPLSWKDYLKEPPPHTTLRLEDLTRLQAHNYANRILGASLQFQHELGNRRPAGA